MSNPVAGHHREKAGLFSSASHMVQIAAAQKKMESGSMVMMSPPTLKMGVTLMSTTVQNAMRASKSRRASQYKSRLVPSARMGAKKRMPNSPWPKSAVLAFIVAAMPGPLLK